MCRLALLLVSLVTPVLAQERPRALVLEIADPWTKQVGAARLLAEAGFEVAPLPLDRSPRFADAEVLWIGSFASESAEYREYVQKFHEDLQHYVGRGHVLVQLTQADQTEPQPPFLPATQGATRSDRDFGQALVLAPQHPLLAGVDAPVQWDPKRTIWETFVHQSGFQVLLAGDAHAQHPALLEGAHGRGRILLAALDFDKVVDGASGEWIQNEAKLAFARTLVRNLAQHALAVRNGKAPAPEVTPPPLAPEEYVEGSWTLAVLPDTQIYALRYPGLFTLQTDWLAANRERLDIRYAIHLGDITDDNTDLEWRRARAALARLDGVVPLALVPGNHDYGPGGDATTRETGLNRHFPFSAQRAMPTFGGAFVDGELDNTFHRFEAGGRKWIVIALEWAPRAEAVAWADGVMRQHPDHKGILVTHAYMNNNDRRYDHTDQEHPQLYNPHQYKTPGKLHDGEELWQQLVRKHDFLLTLNGHVLGDGTGYLASRNDRGHTCHQMLANFQMRELGGEGYLRLLEFRPDGKTVVVKTYSPLYESWLLEPDQQFRFELDDR